MLTAVSQPAVISGPVSQELSCSDHPTQPSVTISVTNMTNDQSAPIQLLPACINPRPLAEPYTEWRFYAAVPLAPGSNLVHVTVNGRCQNLIIDCKAPCPANPVPDAAPDAELRD